MTDDQHKKQIAYRDARFNKQYDRIWQSVGKCVFCDLRDKYIIHEEDGIVLTITLFAYIDGHVMIVPRRHVTSPKEFSEEEWQTVRKFMYLAKKLIKKAHNVKGVQFIQKDGSQAQSTVGHIHYHGIPFDAPDMMHWNFRKLKHTPIENAQTYQSLKADITKLSKRYDEKQTAQINSSSFAFDWAELAFTSKRPLNTLRATFIPAPREMSEARFKQIIKEYLPKGSILLGLAKEDFIAGFEGQPHFRSLKQATVQTIIHKVNNSTSPYKIYTLEYFQRELPYILEKIDLGRVLLVNGSWHQAFHTRQEYYTLARKQVPFTYISPFSNEEEAKDYIQKAPEALAAGELLDEASIMQRAQQAAMRSFAYDFQTGAALAKKTGRKYTLLATSCNQVVPYATYALHHGAAREKHFSPPNDLNHYDAVHAEVFLLLEAAKRGIELKDTSLFINLLPCPTCARMLAASDISEFVYAIDHSDGYAINMLTEAGKSVRRLTQKGGE